MILQVSPEQTSICLEYITGRLEFHLKVASKRQLLIFDVSVFFRYHTAVAHFWRWIFLSPSPTPSPLLPSQTVVYWSATRQ